MAPLQLVVAVAATLTSVAANGISAGYCRALDGSGFNSSIFYLNKRSVGAEAVCNDGSPAQMYFRPCCDGETAGDFCNESAATWFVVFGDGNQDGWCWDAESCAERAAASPMLTSSEGLPEFWSRFGSYWEREVGAFSKGGETNQNFYKSYAAYIPHCSSDLFLGDCEGDGASPAFCGKSIAKAAVRNLLPEMAKYGADRIFLVGGAGIMMYLEELRSLLPSSAEVKAVCDGCVLLDGGASGACSGADAFSCAPKETLPQAVELWRASLPQDCDGWRCLTSSATEGAIALAASQMPVLAQHPLYDRLIVAESSPSAVRDAVAAALSAATVSVGGGCSAPQSAFTRPEMFTVRYGGGFPPLTYASALLALADGQPLRLVDSCDGADCNPSCNTTLAAPAGTSFI